MGMTAQCGSSKVEGKLKCAHTVEKRNALVETIETTNDVSYPKRYNSSYDSSAYNASFHYMRHQSSHLAS